MLLPALHPFAQAQRFLQFVLHFSERSPHPAAIDVVLYL